MTAKNFVIDTNVVLYDPNAIFNFEDNQIIIPIWVIEEIDNHKKDIHDTGRNAREFSRHLDRLRQKGDLTKGVPLEGGGSIRVWAESPHTEGLPSFMRKETYDNLILATAAYLHKQGEAVIFITKDINLRLKADALGIVTSDYETQRVEVESLHKGWRQVAATEALINEFYQNKKIAPSALPTNNWAENEFACLTADTNPSQSALGIHKKGDIWLLPPLPQSIWGIRPRNLEQSFALHLLLDDTIPLVTMSGKAGTGKTLLALAAGLLKTLDENRYEKLMAARPIFPIGRDIGFLPGEIKEKLRPWMQPIFDNLEFLLHSQKGDRKGPRYQTLIDQGLVEIEALTYIRGRSIPNQYFLVDEAQNLTPHEAKTILTRVGQGTKIVLTGDIYQIDNFYNDSTHNGLSYIIERLRLDALAGHINLTKGERSPLAEVATNLL